MPKWPPHDFAKMTPPRKVGPYSVFFSFALIMDRFFRSDFFCREKAKSVFSKRRAIIRIFDIKKKSPHSSLKIQNVCQKINKNHIYTSKLALFSLRFSRFCPKSSPEISFFFKNQIYNSISVLFLPQK